MQLSQTDSGSSYSIREWIPPPAGLAAAILIDSTVDGTLGGTGELFDPSIARKFSDVGIPVIVAGGVHPENVAEGMENQPSSFYKRERPSINSELQHH